MQDKEIGQKLSDILESKVSEDLKKICLRELIYGPYKNSIISYLRKHPITYSQLNISDLRALVKALVSEEPVLPKLKSLSSSEILEFYDTQKANLPFVFSRDPISKLFYVSPTGTKHSNSRTHVMAERSIHNYFSIGGLLFAMAGNTDARSFARVYSDHLVKLRKEFQDDCLYSRKRWFYKGNILSELLTMLCSYYQTN